MKVKKIISTLLALSMCFGSFAALNIASAASEDDSVVLYQTGFDGETTLKEDGWGLEFANAIKKTASGEEAYGNVLEFSNAGTSDLWPEMYHSIVTEELSEITDGEITLEYDFSMQNYGTPVSERTFIHTGFSDVGFRNWNNETGKNDTKRYYLAGLDAYKLADGTYSPYIKGMKIAQGFVGADNYVTDSSWMKVKAVYNMDASTVKFYIDNTLLYTWKNDGTVTEPEILKGVFLNGVAAPGAVLWYDNLKVTYDSTPYNVAIYEDFDGENHDASLYGKFSGDQGNTVSVTEDPENAENSVLKIASGEKTEKYNYIKGITPKENFAGKLPDALTGKLVYSFDIFFPETNTRPSATNYYNVGLRSGKFDGQVLGYLEAKKAYKASAADRVFPAVDGWYNVEIEFDYTDKTFSAWADDQQFVFDETFDVTNGNPIDGISLRAWIADWKTVDGTVAGQFDIYVDNINIGYVHEEPVMVEGIKVSEIAVADNAVAVDNEVYYTLSEADVEVILADGYQDAKVTKTITEENGAKTVAINVKDVPYENNYSVTVTPEIEGLYVENTNSILVPDNTWGTVTEVTDPLNENNQASKITAKGLNNGVTTNFIAYIKPSAEFKAYLPETKTGQLIYQFDILHGDVASDVSFRDLKTTATFGAVGTKSDAWRTMKIVFDLESGKSTCWHGTQRSLADIDFTSANPSPLEGIQLRAWAPVDFSFYIDNISVAYVSEKPELLTDIKVAGVSVDNFDYTKQYQTVKLTQAEYDEVINGTDVSYTLADGVAIKAGEIRVVNNKNGVKSVNVIVDCGKYEKAVYTVNVEVVSKTAVSDFVATKTETGITASANFVLGNDVTEEGNPYVIIAVYENDRLIGTELVDADEDEDGVATFDLTYNMDAAKTYTAKAMLWNMTTLLPLVSAQTVTVE